jgi:hypothetical protein
LKRRLCCRETLDRNSIDARCCRNRKSIKPAKIRKDAIFARATVLVRPAHSRWKNGVALLAYVAGIHVFAGRVKPKMWMAGTSPAMTVCGASRMFTQADLLYSRAVVLRPT